MRQTRSWESTRTRSLVPAGVVCARMRWRTTPGFAVASSSSSKGCGPHPAAVPQQKGVGQGVRTHLGREALDAEDVLDLDPLVADRGHVVGRGLERGEDDERRVHGSEDRLGEEVEDRAASRRSQKDRTGPLSQVRGPRVDENGVDAHGRFRPPSGRGRPIRPPEPSRRTTPVRGRPRGRRGLGPCWRAALEGGLQAHSRADDGAVGDDAPVEGRSARRSSSCPTAPFGRAAASSPT